MSDDNTPPPGNTPPPPAGNPPPPAGNPPPPAGNQPAEPLWSSLGTEGEEAEIRGLMETKGYKDYKDVAKSYYHLNKMVKGSTDVVAIPKDDDPVGQAALWERLGRPKAADGYDLQLPNDAQIDDDFAKQAKGWFHGANLTNSQAANVVKQWQGYMTERVAKESEEATRQKEAEVAEIKQKYGQTFDTQMARGKNAVKAVGLSDDLLNRLEEQMGAPAVVELMVTLGDKIGREDVKIDGISKDGFGSTKAELQSRQSSMKGNPEIVRALTDPRDPNHSRYKREWDEVVLKLAKM